MPVDHETTLAVTCDNPSCPGHPDLDPGSLAGWLVVTHEVYGEPTGHAVFGSEGCLSTLAAAVDAGELSWPAPETSQNPPPPARG